MGLFGILLGLALLMWLAYRGWKRLRTTWFGRPFVRLGEYLNATNVPEAAPPTDN